MARGRGSRGRSPVPAHAPPANRHHTTPRRGGTAAARRRGDGAGGHATAAPETTLSIRGRQATGKHPRRRRGGDGAGARARAHDAPHTHTTGVHSRCRAAHTTSRRKTGPRNRPTAASGRAHTRAPQRRVREDHRHCHQEGRGGGEARRGRREGGAGSGTHQPPPSDPTSPTSTPAHTRRSDKPTRRQPRHRPPPPDGARAARHTGRSPSAFPDGRSGTRGAKHHRVTETRDRDTDEERDWRRTQQARQQEPPGQRARPDKTVTTGSRGPADPRKRGAGARERRASSTRTDGTVEPDGGQAAHQPPAPRGISPPAPSRRKGGPAWGEGRRQAQPHSRGHATARLGHPSHAHTASDDGGERQAPQHHRPHRRSHLTPDPKEGSPAHASDTRPQRAARGPPAGAWHQTAGGEAPEARRGAAGNTSGQQKPGPPGKRTRDATATRPRGPVARLGRRQPASSDPTRSPTRT